MLGQIIECDATKNGKRFEGLLITLQKL